MGGGKIINQLEFCEIVWQLFLDEVTKQGVDSAILIEAGIDTTVPVTEQSEDIKQMLVDALAFSASGYEEYVSNSGGLQDLSQRIYPDFAAFFLVNAFRVFYFSTIGTEIECSNLVTELTGKYILGPDIEWLKFALFYNKKSQ